VSEIQYENVNARLPASSVSSFKSKVKDADAKIAPVILAMTTLYTEDQGFYELVNAKVDEITAGLKRNERSDKGVVRGKQKCESRRVRVGEKLYTQEELEQIVGK
jgi:hypothetical protein